MKIVKFKNGGYGIRTGWLFHKYVDLTTPSFEWNREERHFKDCVSEDKEKVVKIYNLLTDKGTPIGEEEYE